MVSACAILGALLYRLAGGSLLRETTVLFLFIPDATGLGPDSPVRVDGIDVGKVISVSLSGSNEPNRVVKVMLAVARERLRDIPMDSSSQISADNVVGDQFVDITSGRSGEHIRPGGEIAYKEEAELLKTLDIAQFESQLRILDGVLSDIEAGRGLVGQFVIGEDMYNGLTKEVNEIERGIRAAARTATPTGQALYSDSLYREIVSTLAGFDKTLAALEAGRDPSGRFLRDPAEYDSLRQGAIDLRRSIAGWRGSELVNSDGLYTDWNGRIASLIQAVDEWNAGPASGASQAYDSLNGAAKELSETLRDLRSDPRKFLRIKVF